MFATSLKEFELCFKNKNKSKIDREVSYPSWYGIKTSIIDAACVHNLDIFLTGLLREIYLEYVTYVYESNENSIIHNDELPKYSYDMLRNCLFVWYILEGLGHGNDEKPDRQFTKL